MYPTKKEILEKKPKFRNGTILITNLWKATSMKTWKKDEPWVKIEKLSLLIQALSLIHLKEPPKILYQTSYACNKKEKKIYVDYTSPSIISTLHETAHYIFGPNDLKACQWSIWLFKECFPESYKKLIWNKYLLIKGNSE